LGYRAEIVPPVMVGDTVCSSTLIRQLLEAGETERAQRLLHIEEAQGAVTSDIL
jgi:FAD synthase